MRNHLRRPQFGRLTPFPRTYLETDKRSLTTMNRPTCAVRRGVPTLTHPELLANYVLLLPTMSPGPRLLSQPVKTLPPLTPPMTFIPSGLIKSWAETLGSLR